MTDANSTLKTCTKCRTTKPTDQFFLRKERGTHYTECKQCRSSRRAANYAKTKDQQKAKNREWIANNPERWRAIQRDMARKKREKYPAHRVHGRISNQIWKRMRRIDRNKGRKATYDLLGFTHVELCRHLEMQFTGGMGWHNMGEWHIDHVVPLSSFNINGPDDPEIRRAWALTNLRPLWAKDNILKKDKRVYLI